MKASDLPPHLRAQFLAARSPGIARSKYGSRRTIAGGRVFDSAKEARRFGILRALERTGAIRQLKLQKSFDLAINGRLVCKYVADFVYEQNGKNVVEDVKSAATRKNRAYRIKVKLMKAIHDIEIREV